MKRKASNQDSPVSKKSERNLSEIKKKISKQTGIDQSVPPVELEKPTRQTSKPKMRHRGAMNEANLNKIKGLKNLASRMAQDQKIEHLIGKMEEIESDSSTSSIPDFKINMKFTRKTLNIKRFVKNQLTQTEEKFTTQKRKKKLSISNSSNSARRSFKHNKVGKESVVSSMSFIDEFDIGEENYVHSDSIFLSKDFVKNIEDIISNKIKKSAVPKGSRGKGRRSTFSKVNSLSIKPKGFKSLKLKKSFSGSSRAESINSEPETQKYSAKEVTKLLEGLYDKLLVCLDNPSMRQKFENSFKGSCVESTKCKDNKSKQEVFKAKMIMIKMIKSSTQKLLEKFSIKENIQKCFFMDLKDLIEKESIAMNVDPDRNIKVIFKDIFDGEDFNLPKTHDIADVNNGLIGIEEVNSSVSDNNPSLSQEMSLHTLYSQGKDSPTSMSANKKDKFQNEQIRLLSGLQPAKKIVETK